MLLYYIILEVDFLMITLQINKKYMNKILIILSLLLIPVFAYAYTSFDWITITWNNPIELNTQKIFSLPTYWHTTLQSNINGGVTRMYLMPNWTPPATWLRSGLKLFSTDYSQDSSNYFDAWFYVTEESVRFNSKRNWSFPDNLPFKWSFQDTDVKMSLDKYGTLSAVKFVWDGSALTWISCDEQIIRDIVNEILLENTESTTPVNTTWLIAHYLFDWDATDETANHNGVVYWAVTDWDSYSFDGNDYIEVWILSSSNFTYMFDFIVTSDISGALTSKYDGSSKIQQLYYDAISNKIKLDFGQVWWSRNIISTNEISLNTRYKVVISWDWTTSKIYLNWILQNSSTIIPSDWIDAKSLDIWRRNNDGSYFYWKIYEAKYYDITLSESEIINF